MAAVCLVALGAVCRQRRRTRRTLETMNRMLDAAMQGDFAEDSFDETLLSAMESRLAHYLAASATSAQQVAAEKEKLKSLIADISHQTKTPLANVLLYAQLLLEQPLSEESRRCVFALEGQAAKLQSLIEALVKTSRLESGVLALHPRRAGLAPMLEEAVAQFMPKAAEKRIALTLASSEGEGVFDPKWTAEAVCNLLDNAVKYTPAGGAVTVTTHCYELFCRIDVADTGPGIPEEEQAKVFGRFYRGPANDQAQGVGIGLYLARQIAEGQGGYIRVLSPPGQGTVFSLYLPRG